VPAPLTCFVRRSVSTLRCFRRYAPAATALATVAVLGLTAGCGAVARAPGKPAAPAAVSDTSASPEAVLKIDSQLLVEIHRLQGKPVPPDKTTVKLDEAKRALVDVRAVVTPELQKTVLAAGGTIVSTSTRDHSILAWVPLLKIEQLAGDAAIRAIVPAAAIIR
jgi:hypothetical protein